MNGQQMDQKTQLDVTQVKKDIAALREDGINKVSKAGENLDHTNEDVAAWVNSGATLLSNKLEKVKGDATKTVAHATTAVKKNVGSGLTQYNAKVAEVAKKLPGGVAVKAGKYPWVAISLGLMVGFLLGGFVMPRRNHIGNSNQPCCTQNVE